MGLYNVYIKVEANVKTGGGHLHRSLVLADEFKRFNCNVEFIVSYESADYTGKMAGDYNVNVINDIYNPSEYAGIVKHNSLIIFDTDDNMFYSGQLVDYFREQDVKTACFTISNKYTYTTDFLINTNIIALSHEYITGDYTVKLLGPEYLIFKPQFAGTDLEKTEDNNLLVYFGNADRYNLTERVLAYFEHRPGLFDKINVITGSLNKNIKTIKEICSRNEKIVHYHNLTTDGMIDVYKDSGVTIGSAGMAMWEMALFGIPQIIIASSEREVEYTDYLNRAGYVYKLSDYKHVGAIDMEKELDEVLKSDILTILKTEEFSSVINVNGVTKIVKSILKYL
ncbi:MAG: hypothetical protein GXO47_14940 [Chlorobi bacterium]|nr:hypothetical protein [Chlorobiota bacterium]